MSEFEIIIKCNHKIIAHRKAEIKTQKEGILHSLLAITDTLKDNVGEL